MLRVIISQWFYSQIQVFLVLTVLTTLFSNSDVGSESDSGLGSVRTSKKESDSQEKFNFDH